MIAVNPLGDFPVNDDWAYLYSVKALLAGEGIRFSDWSAQNLISQVFWGAGFASVLGVSYTALRFSTLVAAFIGAIALYRLFRLAKATPGVALLGVLTSLFNPLSFNLAFSYMTDVPYAAFQLVAMWLLAEGLISGRRVVQALGWVAGVAALLCRQVGLFIPVGIAGEAVLRRPWSWRRVLIAAGAVAVFGAIQWGFQRWLQVTGKASELYGRQINSISDGLTNPLATLEGALVLVRDSFFYLGLLALPLTLACVPAWRDLLPARFRRSALMAVAIAATLVFLLALVRGWLFPTWENTINFHTGLGVEFAGTPLPRWGSIALTAAASVGGVLLVAAAAGALARWWSAPRDRFDVAAFAAITGLCLLAPVALIEMRYDRYLIPVLPCLLLALTSLVAEGRVGRRALLAGFGAVIGMALISIGGTHDHLAAKRVHWQVYSELVKTVPPRYVDGGWSANGAMSFGTLGATTDYLHWFERADYLIWAGERPGYVVVQAFPVERWLPWNRDGAPILLMKRAP